MYFTHLVKGYYRYIIWSMHFVGGLLGRTKYRIGSSIKKCLMERSEVCQKGQSHNPLK